jgi:hypothetical protein
VARPPFAERGETFEPTLKRWRLRTPGVLVFPDPNKGGLMSRKAALGCRLRTACRHAGVNVVRVHDLRHTYALSLHDGGRRLVPAPELPGALRR